jgi:hypothetical protein
MALLEPPPKPSVPRITLPETAAGSFLNTADCRAMETPTLFTL